jgi:hypothetical protein
LQWSTVIVLSRFRWALLQLIRYIVGIVTMEGRERGAQSTRREGATEAGP